MRNWQKRLFLAIAALGIGGCQQFGQVDLREQYYLGASNGTEMVYYRVTIQADTFLANMQFRQGWYPAYAVDQLFGDVSDNGVVETLSARDEIRKQIDEKLKEARTRYLEVAADPDSSNSEVEAALRAVMRVRLDASPSLLDSDGILDKTHLIEYDPDADLSTRRAGHKKIYLLSADPNQVIQELQRLAADTDTQKLISDFNKALTTAISREATDTALETIQGRERISRQLAALHDAADDDSVLRSTVLSELDATISVLGISQ